MKQTNVITIGATSGTRSLEKGKKMKQVNTMNVGSVGGNNNQFQNNNYQINNKQSPGKGESDPGVGFAVLFGIAGVLACASFLYLKNFELLMLCLQAGALSVGGVYLATLAAQLFDPYWEWGRAVPVVLGVVLICGQLFLSFGIATALPNEVFKIANEPLVGHGWVSQAFEVWNRFSQVGKNLIIGNMTSALLLAAALASNLLLATYLLARDLDSIVDTVVLHHVHRVLRFARISGPVASVACTCMSYWAMTGGWRI